MDELRHARCVPAREGEPPLADDAIAALRAQVPEWQLIEREGLRRLGRAFHFRDFRQALDFTVRVGEMAEEQDHHPEILLTWGRATVETWTHTVRGLHRNDFVLAARTDALYETSPHS